MSEIDHVGLWNRCLEIIRDNVPEQTYKTWFLPIIPLKYEDKTLVVQVPSQFFYEFLEDKFVDLLRKTLYKVIGEGTKLMYNVMVDKSSRKTVDLESTQRTIIPQKQMMDKIWGDNFLLSNSERTYNSDGGRIKKSASQRRTL